MNQGDSNKMLKTQAAGFVLLCVALVGCGSPPPEPGPKTAALIAALRSAEVAEESSVEIDPPFATGTWIISAAYCLEGRWPSLGVSLPASDREWLFEFNNNVDDTYVIYIAPGEPVQAEHIGGWFRLKGPSGAIVVKECCDRFRLSRPDAGKMVLIEGVAVPEKR
jgi:hypothetical protein